MALFGRFNSLQVAKHTDFGLYLDGGPDGEILLPKRYVPKDQPTEVGDWLNVFLYLDSEDRPVATTLKPKVQVGGFASLKVVEINRIGLFLDWGLPKDLLLPHSEEKRPLQVGDYCVVHVYLDKRTRRITATARLDRYLDQTPPRYKTGQEVDLLVVEKTDLGFKAIGLTEEFVGNDTSPFRHLSTDTTDTVDLDYLALATQLAAQVVISEISP